MRVLPRHDVFVIYSQAEPEPVRLMRAFHDDLVETGFTNPGYEEMDWYIDGPVPQVNTPMLQRYFEGAKCVIAMARQLTAGVVVELETLAKDTMAPPVLEVTWGGQGVGHEGLAPFATYAIPDWRDEDAADHALRLRAWVWMCVLLSDLLALGPFGHWVIGDLMAHDKEARAIVRACRRFPQALRDAASADGEPPLDPDPELPLALKSDEAVGVWRYWTGGADLIARRVIRRLPEPLAKTLESIRMRLQASCMALERRFPGAMVLDSTSRAALSQARMRVGDAVQPGRGDYPYVSGPETSAGAEFDGCMMRALQRSERPRTAELALQDFAQALKVSDDANLGPVFRHNALVERAAALIRLGRLDAALVDLDEVIASEATSDEHARFSARHHRGGARYALEQWAGAIEDYGAVIADRRAPITTRLSARLRRGAAHEQAGDVAAARVDYDAVLADVRAADSTRRAAQRNLKNIAGRA